MQNLTSSAMAELRIQRLFPAQLICDPLAMAAALIPNLEPVHGIVDPVGSASLPLINALCAEGLASRGLGLVVAHFVG